MKLLATGAAILVVLAVSAQARAAEFLKAEDVAQTGVFLIVEHISHESLAAPGQTGELLHVEPPLTHQLNNRFPPVFHETGHTLVRVVYHMCCITLTSVL